ncbi:hypothetical protein Ndes2526B_g07087 [Nannochloris sp. 'desiccata']
MERFCHRQELVPRSGMSGTLLKIACRGVLGSNRLGPKGLSCLVGPRPLSHPFPSAFPLSRIGWRGCKAAAPATEAAPTVERPDSNGAFKSTAYPFTEIEEKWQAFWEEHQTFRTPEFKDLDTSKPKFYALDMFPYPSGAGLHVGHPEGYTATDIIARYKRMRGYNVLHPMGWDAFGLPAEQYAIQTGTHPAVTTFKNIDRFRTQLQSLGFSYDWQREVATCDPSYYKWTQWIFLQLLKRDLAYQAEVPVNWCPALGTVLANEEVIDGLSERGNHPVVRMPMKQWMLKITAYADRLISDLEGLDWGDSIKEMQKNWIGRSEGANVRFELQGGNGSTLPKDAVLEVYTTRPDTLFGVTYMVVAPEHPLLSFLATGESAAEVKAYAESAAKKSDLERTELAKHKTGVFTGSYAINPATGEPVPIWVADYVLGNYGSGAIMAVPGHDTRDFEFAQTFNLPIKRVVEGGEELPFTQYGGKSSQLFKLVYWQRYWGEPFPVVYPEGSDTPVGISEADLPLVLPDTDDFAPSGTPDPPLAKQKDWVAAKDPTTGGPASRETSTMPQWAGSCWYYLRFIDPGNDSRLVSEEAERYWMPVDLYVGGAEHAVLHLLYARFWHKVLYDAGVVSTAEPFQRLVSQGMILGEVEYTVHVDPTSGRYVEESAPGAAVQRLDPTEVEPKGNGYVLKADNSVKVAARAHKMSKSRGNVINPDDIVGQYGADSLRLYEMFMGPLRETKTWNTKGVEGVHRFLARVYRLIAGDINATAGGAPLPATIALSDDAPSKEQLRLLHQTIKKVTEETEELRFNTGISAMMEFVNGAYKWENRPREVLKPFILLLAPYAPHLAEEMWVELGEKGSLAYEPWPVADESLLVEDSVKLPVQVNGKTRGTVEVPKGCSQEAALEVAQGLTTVAKQLEGKEVKKVIFVADKILNLVVK